MPSTDLLIRSATTLLSIIDQQVEKPLPSSEDRSVRFLDHIALLFVTKSKEDVSAVSVVLAEHDSLLVGCTEQSSTDSAHEDTAEHLLGSKNPPKAKGCHTTQTLQGDASLYLPPSFDTGCSDGRIGRNWLFECCRKGGPMGSGEYAMQLQFLLGDIRDPKVPNSHVNFTRCVYYHCYPKILQRMRLPVAQGGLPFKDLFAPGNIDDSELLARFHRPSDEAMDGKIARHGDQWINDVWKLAYNKSPEFEGHNMVYNETTVIEFHRLIQHVFKCLFKSLSTVGKARQMHTTRPPIKSEADIIEVETALDAIAFYMDVLAHLVKSPCFWVHIRQPVVKEWISKQARKPDSSRECQLFDTDDEEDIEAQEEAADHPADAVTRWLQSASQWSVAVSEIIEPNSRTTPILLSREVKILSLKVPTVTEPGKQSSLNSLLAHVSKGSTFLWRDAAITLQRVAATKESSEANGGRAGSWSLLTNKRWDEWETNFTGKHHCESILASLLERKPEEGASDMVKIAQRAKKAIGVSKRCCFCCALYLRHLNPDLSFGATSGKAYPWALPPWGEQQIVGDAILKVLTERLRRLLVGMGTPTEKAYDSGSDSGRSDGGQPVQQLRKPAPADFGNIYA